MFPPKKSRTIISSTPSLTNGYPCPNKKILSTVRLNINLQLATDLIKEKIT